MIHIENGKKLLRWINEIQKHMFCRLKYAEKMGKNIDGVACMYYSEALKAFCFVSVSVILPKQNPVSVKLPFPY